MSQDIAVFHSSEADDPNTLPGDGWYVGGVDASGTLVTDDAIGPYFDNATACKAMVAGVWLYGEKAFPANQ